MAVASDKNLDEKTLFYYFYMELIWWRGELEGHVDFECCTSKHSKVCSRGAQLTVGCQIVPIISDGSIASIARRNGAMALCHTSWDKR